MLNDKKINLHLSNCQSKYINLIWLILINNSFLSRSTLSLTKIKSSHSWTTVLFLQALSLKSLMCKNWTKTSRIEKKNIWLLTWQGGVIWIGPEKIKKGVWRKMSTTCKSEKIIVVRDCVLDWVLKFDFKRFEIRNNKFCESANWNGKIAKCRVK